MSDPTSEQRFWASVSPGQSPDSTADALKGKFGVFEASPEGMYALCAAEVMRDALGFGRSARTGLATLGDGRPVPMISYGLIEYLMGLDLADKDVLELGGGQSTLFWADAARSVVTVEQNAAWLAELGRRGLGNVRLAATSADGFVDAARAVEGSFDVIVIDCAANRYLAAEAVIGAAVLREVVGADPRVPVARSDLFLTHRRALAVKLLLLPLEQP